MRFLITVSLLLFISVNAIIQAQSIPTVEIILSQPNAVIGDTVKAAVYIKNGVNIGGADIGIVVDETCLRVTNRITGTYLPSESDAGGFSPRSELSDYAARFSAAITDRTKLAQGDGIFYTVDLQVTCENAIAPLTIVFAELSAYKDPTAAQIEFIAYTISANTVNLMHTALIIDSPAPTQEALGLPIVPIVLICLTAVGLSVLIAAFIILRRRMTDDDAEV